MYCQICLVGGAAKHQARRKLKKILDNVNFKVYAKKWKNKNHNYYKVFGFVDRENSDENLAHKFCKAIFSKIPILTRNLLYLVLRKKVKFYQPLMFLP